MSESFDAYSSNYEDTVQSSIAFSGLEHDFFLQAKIRVLAELFQDRFGHRRPALLDIGCGVGRMHPMLLPMVSKLAGTDISTEAIDRARHDNPSVDYRPSSRDGLPWPDASFAATLAVCVLHHVPPDDRQALLTEMRRVTSPGGLVIVIEHNPWNPLTRLAVARCPFDHDAELLTARHTRELLEQASLRAVNSRHFLLLPTAASWAASLERLFRHVPMAAQYLTVGEV